ncbi:MAG: LamG-like jellyroll fold domain-containing protein [Micromonosporaceae bacterium]
MATVKSGRGVGRSVPGAARTTASRWLVVALLLAGTCVATLTPSLPAAAESGAETPSEEAKRTGVRVVVPEKTTEAEQTFANPDGTFTLEASAVPVRARKGGAWVAVDTTLVRGTDGLVAPKAAIADMSFSGGGSDAPLARISRAGRSIELWWPRSLPSPTLSGSTATYGEVFPGVDLVVAAAEQSFSEVLVVKTSQAARNPSLRQVTLGMRLDGVSVRPQGGGLVAVDNHGVPVFGAPQPSMWDSGADGAGIVPVRDRVRGPREGDRVAPMQMAVSQTALSVVPDEALLTGSTTRFPLYIDPTTSLTMAARTMVDQRYDSAIYNWGGDGKGAEGLGYIVNSYDGWHRKRLYFRFATTSLAGTHILGATFKAYETWAYNCTKSEVELWRTDPFAESTKWSNQPAWREYVASRTVAYGYSGCSPDGAWVEFNAVNAVADAAAGRWSRLNLGMRAGSESQADTSWKRFRRDAILSVTYNTVPTAPSSVRTIDPATSCVSSTSPPAIPSPPKLVAWLNDADGSKGQLVRGHFTLYHKGGALIGEYITAFKKPGADYTYQSPALGDGTYSWRVRAYDQAGAWSSYSAWCDFRVDSTRPKSPTISVPAGQTYSYGGQATFTFVPGDSTDVTKYKWSLNADAPTSGDVPAGTPEVTTTLNAFGPTTIRAWSYDAAGNPSDPPGTIEFNVAGGAPRNQWRLDENAGTTTIDAVRGEPLTMSSGCSWTFGRWHDADPTDYAVSFNGTSGVASRSGGLMWVNRNFSVAARVRLTDDSTTRVAVSQDGSGYGGSGFSIRAVPDPDPALARYEFALGNPNDASTIREVAASWVGPIDEWWHLTGVFEPATHTMRLYVNGTEQAAVTVPFDPSQYAGPFVLGRGRNGTVPSYYWQGDVDEVRAFYGALSPAQVDVIANEPRP